MIIDPYLMTELVRSRQADCLAMAHRPGEWQAHSRPRSRTLDRARLVAGETLIQFGQWVCGCATTPAKRAKAA